MKSAYQSPLQFYTINGIGLGLANAAAHKRLGAPVGRQRPLLRHPILTGNVLNDIIALGGNALIAHVGQLLTKDPIRVIQEGDAVIRIRVCGALDYVIDRAQHLVWVEPAPLTWQELCATEQPPWHYLLDRKCHNVDLLNPLCNLQWLNYVAARPGWFGYAFSRHSGNQKQLFIEQDEVAHAMRMVIRAAWRYFLRDKAFIALRCSLATELTLHIGPSAINLAMRSRLNTQSCTLDARHMSRALRFQQAYATMACENPRLLPALTAWLMHTGKDTSGAVEKMHDALPLMRRDLLAHGLQPKSWRYLALHGFKRLWPSNLPYKPWQAMLEILQALEAAQWPTLPPRNFLSLLHNRVGPPRHYVDISDRTTGGWLWQIACEEASACRGNTAEYSRLSEQILQWAWMANHDDFKPDKNQRRRGRAWLESMQEVDLSDPLKVEAPEWALWLPAGSWNKSHKLKLVPLQSFRMLQLEAFALHNCVDKFRDYCSAESHVLVSLRTWANNKPVALVCVERHGSRWVLGEVAGPCNQSSPPWVQQLAQQAAQWVHYHHSQRKCR